eukprot:COSAG05_NODE_14527_length_394_cov_1.054237_2_plen_41_part_01
MARSYEGLGLGLRDKSQGRVDSGEKPKNKHELSGIDPTHSR